MPDFLLIHDMGHGAWAWSYVRAALEDDLRRQTPYYHNLYQPGAILSPDLPYHGVRQGQGDPEELTFDGAVGELLAEAERAQMRSPTVVAHGLSALIGLEVARRLKSPPRRLVLVGASVPSFVSTVTDMLPLPIRVVFNAHMVRPGTAAGTIRLHREAALRLFCGGMDYPSAASVLGRLGPLPLKLLDSLPHPDVFHLTCPITYVALRRDGLLPVRSQRRMAGELRAELVELDAGHEALFSHPRELAEVVLGTQAAGARGARATTVA